MEGLESDRLPDRAAEIHQNAQLVTGIGPTS
jgi:hypothetical protein